MGYEEHKEISPRSVNCAILTISDSRTEETDESGKFIMARLRESDHRVLAYAVLKNDAAALREKITGLLGVPEVQLIITSGGTGVSHRDITVETVSPLLEKRLDGFGELFRYLTYQELGTASIMSRAIGGVAGGKVILCMPGSLGAVRLAIEKIVLPEAGHLVREATR